MAHSTSADNRRDWSLAWRCKQGTVGVG